ncbi:uncharacterized protein K02A2.6-like [Protobothrops mucrosquamatus]|uniref:uncharacterized protein K02A2.6-like n=1 Tax=Protobothrops mucrosquamatus TaxID=103944 RepID=UPI0007755FF3|nr:uncharacterized protein K02A2.6-like [Protobothrops mucrosquamatus]
MVALKSHVEEPQMAVGLPGVLGSRGQNSRVSVKGEATLGVQFRDFEGPLDIIVVEGNHTSLIGLNWFDALGIQGCILWGSRVVITTSLRTRVLDSLHEGHPGIVRMKALARSYLWWPGLDKDIEAQVHKCHICQQSWPEMPQAPWSRIHIDFAGPFQGQLFLIVVDSHSKWLEDVPVSTTMTARTIQVLRGIFATHGLPDVIVSDNGAQFTSSEVQSFLRANMIRHATSAPFHLASNGQVERMVHTTKESLKRITHGNWHHRLLLTQALCQRDIALNRLFTPNLWILRCRGTLARAYRNRPAFTNWLHPYRTDHTAPVCRAWQASLQIGS